MGIGVPQAAATSAEDSDVDCPDKETETDPYMKVNPHPVAPALTWVICRVKSMLHVLCARWCLRCGLPTAQHG